MKALIAALPLVLLLTACEREQAPADEVARSAEKLVGAQKTEAPTLAQGPYAPRDTCGDLKGATEFRLALAAAVEGRDGGCVAPYCTVPADRCDIDHRINHEDGGCTCAGNLSSACRHHHNGKTDGRCVYLSDPVTGIVVWVWQDGTWAVSVPEGPLTPQCARWAQTVSQYRTTHRKREAAAAKAEAEAKTTEVQEDAPPC